jgi:hypothetical protein
MRDDLLCGGLSARPRSLTLRQEETYSSGHLVLVLF